MINRVAISRWRCGYANWTPEKPKKNAPTTVITIFTIDISCRFTTCNKVALSNSSEKKKDWGTYPKLSSEILHVIDFSVLLGCIHRLHYLLVGHVLLLSTKGFSLGASKIDSTHQWLELRFHFPYFFHQLLQWILNFCITMNAEHVSKICGERK